MDKNSLIIADGKDKYYITCAECGKKTVSFGYSLDIKDVQDEAFLGHLGEDYFLFQGITGSQAVPSEHVEAVIILLKAKILKDLCMYIDGIESFFTGVDAYCYKCNLIYCREHYNAEIIFDEEYPGFYDCTMGTCPQGHERMIDD